MAQVIQRKDKNGNPINSYQITVSAGYKSNGQQIRKTMTWKAPAGMTEKKALKEAQHQAELFEEKVRHNQDLNNSKITFSEYADMYLEKIDVKPRTLETYHAIVRAMGQYIGNMKMKDISKTDLELTYKKLRSSLPINYYTAKDFSKVLKDNNWTVRQASIELGICPQTICTINKGNAVTESTALKVASSLGTKPSDLFNKEVRNSNLKAHTIQHYNALLNSIFESAIDDKIIDINPSRKIRIKNREVQEMHILSRDEQCRLFELLKDEETQFRHEVLLLLYTGMRRGELFGLKWEDVDFSNRVLHIGKRIINHANKCDMVQHSAKTTKSNRYFPLSPQMIAILKAQKEYQEEQQLKYGTYFKDEGYIFTSADGGFVHPNTLTVYFKKFIVRNGFDEEIHVHSLRHTFASNYYNMTKDMLALSRLLGHESTLTTQRVYAHLFEDVAERSIAEMDKLFPTFEYRKEMNIPSKKTGRYKTQDNLIYIAR